MIITRTPFRISFLGGGTDYPDWYREHGGSVLSTTIDKYCYITLRNLPPFFEHRIRVVYARIELCEHYGQVRHPAVRETLRFLDFNEGLEVHHDGDLPARSGMGSSSSFTVGLLHALYALQGRMVSKRRLGLESIHIEQNMIGETVGSQDQMAAAFGGLNRIDFHRNGEIDVHPLILAKARREEFNTHLMLFYTGIRRTASDVADSYVQRIGDRAAQLHRMRAMVDRGCELLQDGGDIRRFGRLMHEAWVEKRGLSAVVSNPVIDDCYRRAREAGALGGKIMGAGGGGFLLLFVPPPCQPAVREALQELLVVPFRIGYNGTQITLYDPPVEDYSEVEADRAARRLQACRELDTIEDGVPTAGPESEGT